MKKFIFQLGTFFLILMISIGSIQNPYTSNYIEQMKHESIAVTTMKDPLYIEIENYANAAKQPAIDAVVHKVWKAIPGYNGLEVDVEASYDKMRHDGHFLKERVVYKEVAPNVHLEDLPSAPIYRGNPQKPMVSFLVNVAWGNEYLPEMLKVMNKYNVKSTFFLDGSWVKSNPKLAKMILDEGHEIGNHAYSHPDLKKMSNARIEEEIRKTNEVINATLDLKPKWFAPPSGSFRQDVVDIAASMDMYTILWTVDTVDWRNPEPNAMVQRVVEKTEPGMMILMHPTESASKGLEDLIIQLQEKGFHLGTVSNLVSEERIFTINPNQESEKLGGNID
ncbi:MAG: polysaccharide deacetylase family protein [Bacillaceae bacterium]|nr:polysaccharide deacetylase family protein [Bacillaceae bacterium]